MHNNQARDTQRDKVVLSQTVPGIFFLIRKVIEEITTEIRKITNNRTRKLLFIHLGLH